MPRALGRSSAAVGLVVLLVASIGGAYAAGLLGAPTVAGVDNRFAGVNATTTLIETDLTVSNPNPIGVNLGGLSVDYTVRLNRVALANGSKQGVSVGTGNSTLTFRTAMANERIPAWWVSHIRNDEHTTLRVEANVTSGLLGRSIEVTPVERPVETDVLSAFNSTETRPVEANSPLVSDPVLYVNETWADWGEVTASSTPMDMAMVVYNPKPVPYAITEIRYSITMNGIDVGEGATTREHVIEPGTRETVRTQTTIRNPALDEWWVSHLRNDQVTALRIEFAATVELPTGQSIDVPLDRLTYTQTIETDFFGNEPGPGETAGGASDDGGESTEATGSTETGTPGSPSDTGDGSGGGSSPTPTPGGGIIGNETLTDTDVL